MQWVLSQRLKSCPVRFSSVAQACPTLCDSMDYSIPGLPVHHQLPEFPQTHVHWVGDAIQPSHPLSATSPPIFNPSQRLGLFKWVISLHQVAKIFGVSASASILPVNIQDWFPLRWTGWISLQSKVDSRIFSNTTVQKHHFFSTQFLYIQLSHPYMTTGKITALTRWTYVGKVVSLLFNMRSRLVITFLPRSKCLLISWLQSPSAVILEPKNIKSVTVSTVSPSICQEVMGPDAMILVFWMLSFKPTFSLSSHFYREVL